MALNINGTTGISGVDGSASAPALTGTDSNTGINFASDTVNINTGGSTRATITSTGDLGIGISAPDVGNTAYSAVQVHSSSTNAYYKLSNGTTGSGSGDGLEFSLSGSDGFITNRESANLIFRTAATERLRIDSTGRLGIGTQSPNALLDLAVGASTASVLRLTSNNTGSGNGDRGRIEVFSATSSGTAYEAGNIEIDRDSVSAAAGKIRFRTNGGSGVQERMRIDSTGNIGAPTGSNIFNASDSRVKKNVVDLDKGLSAIKSLRPVSFNWIDGFCDDEKNTLYGFLAQEVQTVDSNLVQNFANDILVNENKIENVLRVNEKFLVPMLVKAVQELEAKVAALETKVAALEAG